MASDGDAFGNVGANDHCVRVRDIRVESAEVGEVGVVGEPAVVGVREVAVAGVPGYVAFEEQDVVPARRERPEERAECRGVAVAPGGA